MRPSCPARRVLAIALLAIVGCHRTHPPARPPSVLLVTFDTTRRDHCSLYGYERPTTPNLERLGADGAVFDGAYTASSSTAPSHATLFTGLFPLTHGVLRNGLPLAASHVTLAEMAHAAGWQTAAFVGSFVLGRTFGWAQGFDVYDDAFRQLDPHADANERKAAATTALAIDWLEHERDPHRRFFLFVHYFDPHQPYDAPPPFAGRWRVDVGDVATIDRGRYDEEIAYADDALGHLLAALDRLGLRDDTIVVVTSDHGEGLGQHKWRLHGLNLYDEAVRAVLVIRWPMGIDAQRVRDAPVAHVDVLPTVAELAGLAPPADVQWQGRSLAAALRGTAAFDRDHPIFLFRRLFETVDPASPKAKGIELAVKDGRWKYIVGREENVRELFDLAADPGESENLIDRESQRAAELAAMVDAWEKDAIRPYEHGRSDDKTRERLRALGYVE